MHASVGGFGAAPSDNPPVLACHGVSAGYGSMPAVSDLNVEVRRGEVVGILGANGVGKTTTLRVLAGALRPSAGEVRWNGQRTTDPLYRRVRRTGLRYVTEERSVFMTMSVLDNLRLGRNDPEKSLHYFPELRPLLKRPAGLLSGGEQQMLTLSRALAGEPSVLLADELSLGLAPIIVTRLLRAVRAAADEGAAVVLVEQHVSQALAVVDRAYVLKRGRVVLSGTADELRSNAAEVELSYLSGDSIGGAPSPENGDR